LDAKRYIIGFSLKRAKERYCDLGKVKTVARFICYIRYLYYHFPQQSGTPLDAKHSKVPDSSFLTIFVVQKNLYSRDFCTKIPSGKHVKVGYEPLVIYNYKRYFTSLS